MTREFRIRGNAGAPDCITLWTNDPTRAGWADRHGVDRIGLDLETHGKARRQSGLPTWISPHVIGDLERIRGEIDRALLFVRCNPLHDDTCAEVEELLARGVEILMLPNFTTAGEIEAFLRIVDGRVRVTPLIERAAALECLPQLKALGVDEVHVGLNDLSIDMRAANRLVVMASAQLERFAAQARSLGIRFGLGGLARALDDSLPVPSDLVYAQHARLGASGALLARSFFRGAMDETAFANQMKCLRERLSYWRGRPAEALEAARVRLLGFADVPT